MADPTKVTSTRHTYALSTVQTKAMPRGIGYANYANNT